MSIDNSPEEERPFDGAPQDTPEESTPTVGDALRRARVDSGRTVDDLSGATRVRVGIVRAIEADDFASCGGDVYARGHIRALARALGLDPEPLIERFDADRGGRAPSTPATLFEAERIRPERRGPNWTAAMVAAIVGLVGFVGFTIVKDGDDGSEGNLAGGGTPASTESSTPRSEESTPAGPRPEPTDSVIAAAPLDKVTVRVGAVERRSWISAKDHSGKVLFDGLLEEGEIKTFQDDSEINLVLGDAGAVQLHVNGKKIEGDFQPGAVERLTYTTGDPQDG
ncbi:MULTISPECIES: helix-turn-helix domain-containing protein [unclassified Streptomyces]|uniref:helix-turn-helix domain-containing protein n=1 Tax=unclassified Streptomyces TaxID=2593676 RepID=UPI001904ECD2|nr:RodZ domain-containing protein [Streptomyces sp. HSG2]